jgi:hypothetical protein
VLSYRLAQRLSGLFGDLAAQGKNIRSSLSVTLQKSQ